jgi:hypothetical protein
MTQNTNALLVAQMLPELRQRIGAIDHYWSVEDQLYRWIDLWHRYPDRVDIVLVGHTVSGPLGDDVEPKGAPMYMAHVWGNDRIEHDLVVCDVHEDEPIGGMATYCIGAAMAASPIRPPITFSALINATDWNEQMSYPRPFTPREYIRRFRRAFGSHGIEWEWEHKIASSPGWSTRRVLAHRPTTARAAVVDNLMRSMSISTVVSTHNMKWGRWYMPMSQDEHGLMKATDARVRQYLGEAADFDTDFAELRKWPWIGSGAVPNIGYLPATHLDTGVPDVINGRRSTMHDARWISGRGVGGFGWLVTVATNTAVRVGTLEEQIFDVRRFRADGDRTKAEAHRGGDERIRSFMAPIIDELRGVAGRSVGFDATATREWLDMLSWIRNGRESCPFSDWVPYGDGPDGPATGYEDFALYAYKSFVALCRLGQAQRVVPMSNPLYWRIDATIDREVQHLDDLYGFDVLAPSQTVNAYADFILTMLFHEPRRPIDLGPVPVLVPDPVGRPFERTGL